MKPTYEETFDPLTIRGIELCGEYFTDCNLLVDIIAQDMKAYEELERERNELAAQVERLREQITPAVRLMRATGECSGWHEKAEHIEKILSEPSPAALSALKAEAGRDGFIRGYFYSRQYGFQFEEELEAAADKYFNYITRRVQEAGDE